MLGRSGGTMATGIRLLFVAVVTALVGAAVEGVRSPDAGAAARVQQQGVTDDEILVVVLTSDLDGLRARGFQLSPKLTTENVMKRWETLADRAGRINGRTLRFENAVWDPLDNTTFDKACQAAVLDRKPFLVVNGSGYRASDIPCVTVQNDTPMFVGDPVYGALQEASGKNLVSLGVPAEINGAGAADITAQAELFPRTAKIGILSANDPGIKAAGDALEARLEKHDFDVVRKIEINTLQGDNTASQREATAAVTTFQGTGVDSVFVLVPFAVNQAFFQEADRSNAGFETFIVDAGASNCTQFGAARTPVEATGSPCLTTWDTRAVPTGDAVEKDNAFEAECREIWNTTFAEESQPGVPTGDLTAGGVTYTGDMSPNECTMMNLLVPAIKKAGKKLTWPKVHAELMKTTNAPAAYFSNGEGGFGKNKPYFAKYVHLMEFNAVPSDTPRDANGVTFNQCPAPVNCWIPKLVDGEEWFPVGARAKASR